MTKSVQNVLFAKLKNFKCDITKLSEHFQMLAEKYDSIEYKDNDVSYVGWAVTSRDGSLYDGVRRIALKSSNPLDKVRGKDYTEICNGYLKEVMESLKDLGVDFYRARIMQLESEGEEMAFHTDAVKESWRLHIPIITNDESKFEWQTSSGKIESVNLPADGSAYLVRVDVLHKAVNRSKSEVKRVHLLMGCNNKIKNTMIEPLLFNDN